ncbi:MAG: hypothetical protein MMC33_007638 [Icmadophila ericetorum]|nr:hypothetical protein [Icmadophila ericetorum]
MKSLSLISTLAAAATASPLLTRQLEARAIVKPGFTAIFLDQFTGTAGSLPSSSNWIIDQGTQYPGGAPQWGNNELETYTASTSNLQITKSGTLYIIPQKNTTGWTSGRIETQRSDFACAMGKKMLVEASIKLGAAPVAEQQGIWPAFWALGSSFRGNYTNWPAATEWDFLEAVNGASTIYSTAHCGTAPGGPCNEYNGLGDGGIAFTRSVFHTVTFQIDRSMTGPGTKGTWKNETLMWFLDGKSVFSITGAQVGDQNTWAALAHDAHFLLLNVAVGGSWPGNPNSQTIGGVTVGMEVDYGTLEYETFCTPGQCCFASKSDAEGNPQPVVVAVGSLNLADANVLLKNTSTVSIWDAWDCSGSAIKTFNAFNGDANLGTPTIVGGFTFFTN